jgi:hypothetical protein
VKRKSSHVSTPDYVPPSRRHVLLEPLPKRTMEKALVDFRRKNPLLTSRSCDLHHDGARYTATGVSIRGNYVYW